MKIHPIKKLAISITIFFLFVGISYNQHDLGKKDQVFESYPETSTETLKIHIDETNLTQDWDVCPWINGTGTIEDPYVLKNLIIDAEGSDSPILIQNSRKFFKIINCTLRGAEGDYYPENYGGIELYNCSNGIIQNVTSHYNTGNGLFAEISNNITIIESNFSRNDDHGILLYYSENIIIHNNTFRDGGYNGVDIWDCDNITVSSNYLFNQDNTAIDTASSRNLTVINNFINNTGWIGVHSRINTNSNITNNTVFNAEWTGIYLESDEYASVKKNELVNCRDGIDVINCPSANYISENIINTTIYLGIRIFYSYDTQITNNSLYDAFIRFHTELPYILSTNISPDNYVNGKPLRYYENQDWITPPENTGQILAVQCNYVNISNFPQPNFGVGLYYSNHSYFNGNNLMQLEIVNSKNATVTNNEGFSQGMYLRYVNESRIENNNCSNNIAGYDRGIGIKVYYGDNNLISHNNCSNNDYGGIYLEYGNNNTISWNQCNDNIGSGLYDGKGIHIYGSTTWGTNYVEYNYCFRNKMGLRVDSSNTVIRNNILNENLKHAMYSGGGGASSPIINNTCMYNDELAIQGSGDYGVFINNTCEYNTEYGIVLAYADYVILDGNNCSQNYDSGIRLGTQAHYCYAINNFVEENYRYGIETSYSENCTIINNTVIGNYYDNIYISSGSDNAKVIGNNCTAAVGSDSGIRLAYADNCTIANNTCIDNGEAGIYLYYSNSGEIYGNNCSNQGNYGIWLDNSNYCFVYSNNCSYNNLYGIYADSSVGCEISLNYGMGNGILDLIEGTNIAYDNFWGPGPFAWFSVNSTNFLTGQYVQILDKSFEGLEGIAPFSYEYNFSDGSQNSTEQNPLHQFTFAGTFSVILTINDTLGNSSIYTKSITVTNDILPIAYFSTNTTLIIQHQYIEFTDLTTGGNLPLNYQWNFSDGSSNSTIENPIHQYLDYGVFTAILTVIDLNGDVSIYSTEITVLEDHYPSALFTVNSSSIWERQFVEFTDHTSGGDGTLYYQWYFGDGSVNSTESNPIHQFLNSGYYTTTLTVKDEDSDISVYSLLIEVNVNQPNALFTTNATVIIEGEYIQFTDLSVNGDPPLTYEWNFDDVSPNSDLQNPLHQFVDHGTYNVVLTVRDMDDDLDTYSVQITVFPWSEPPEIQVTQDFQNLEYGKIGYLNFTIVDPSTNDAYYDVYHNGSLIGSETWISSEINIFYLEIPLPGFHNYTIFAYDGVGMHANATIWIQITNQNPEIISEVNGDKSQGYVIIVQITDPSVHNGYLTLTYNDEIIFTGDWISGVEDVVVVGILKRGIYNFELTAYDGIGGVTSEIITIKVRSSIGIGGKLSLIIIPSFVLAIGSMYVYMRYRKKKI